MDKNVQPNGYAIHLYQCARRYRYNNDGLLTLFNDAMRYRDSYDTETYTLKEDYLTFGDFDVMQVVPVNSFREYHDVSPLAKDWLGKRQSVLLYRLDKEIYPSRLVYEAEERWWKKCDQNGEGEEQKDKTKKFFCLSMLSLTNELLEITRDISVLLPKLREKILTIVDELNKTDFCQVDCEVFGTFNTSEVGVIWLSDQYVDVLQILDYIKHIKVKVSDKIAAGSNDKEIPVVFTSFSIIAFKETIVSKNVKGKALVQIAVHDVMDSYEQLKKFAQDILGFTGGEEEPANAVVRSEDDGVSYSVGEYDLVIEVEAERAVRLLAEKGLLNVGRRNIDGDFELELRQFLRNNTRLMYNRSDNPGLLEKLEELYKQEEFYVRWEGEWKEPSLLFEAEELMYHDLDKESKGEEQEKNNESYYRLVRQALKQKVSSSAGAVDTLDLLYSDYHSVISNAYNALWVSDLHRQMKAVLCAINSLLDSDSIEWSWDIYRDLTNAFKQQIYHLSQSSRLFFEIPSCHLRSTGQFDFLMHAYYGITKRLVEVIYLMQENDLQSELVPLITVNTVPQVKSQLYFEIGCGGKEKRVINLDIPNSIIFDFQRGIGYLTHELFHYAVPSRREERNYYMAIFLLIQIFRKQFLYVLEELLAAQIDGTTDDKVRNSVSQLIGREKDAECMAEFYYKLDYELLPEYIKEHFQSQIAPHIHKKVKKNDLSNNYEKAIYKFAEGDESQSFYEGLFQALLYPLCDVMLDYNHGIQEVAAAECIKDRIIYCLRNAEYVKRFVRSKIMSKIFTSEYQRHTHLVHNIWSAVREAGSDIAMVSLNGFTIVDYMLFCVQAWTDVNNDKEKILDKMNAPESSLEKMRFAIVAEYFCRQEADGWTVDAEKTDEILIENVQEKFCDRYIWFYHFKLSQNNTDALTEEEKTILCRAHENANLWLKFFSDSQSKFQERNIMYWDILQPVLSEYDIKERVNKLRQQDKNEYAERIEEIQKEFREKVYIPYSNVVDEYSDLERKERYARYIAARFKQDLAIAQHFQEQINLKELGKLNQKAQLKVKVNAFVYPHKESMADSDVQEVTENVWKFHVYSLEELLYYIRYGYDKLNETAKKEQCRMGQRKNATIWFRGHTSETHKLVPTVMRNYKGDQLERYKSLQSYQLSNYEQFKFRADGVPEMPTGMLFTRSDYIAMMQHYGAPTNFLDWTENAFTSLYFALQNYFDKKSSSYRNVTLSMFHPGIYNHVRLQSMNKMRKKLDETKELPWMIEYFKKMLHQENWFPTLIPNLSTKQNEELFDMFLLGNVEAAKQIEGMDASALEEYKQVSENDWKDLFMPLAVLTSRLNPRIRTQCGCFVAYNLYTPPKNIRIHKDSTSSLFDYISLDDIQDRKKSENIFMYQIVIDQSCCMKVVEWLESVGISRENIFPELSEKGYYFE